MKRYLSVIYVDQLFTRVFFYLPPNIHKLIVNVRWMHFNVMSMSGKAAPRIKPNFKRFRGGAANDPFSIDQSDWQSFCSKGTWTIFDYRDSNTNQPNSLLFDWRICVPVGCKHDPMAYHLVMESRETLGEIREGLLDRFLWDLVWRSVDIETAFPREGRDARFRRLRAEITAVLFIHTCYARGYVYIPTSTYVYNVSYGNKDKETRWTRGSCGWKRDSIKRKK